MGLEIGDTVTIRQWDDMVNKFGINSYGDIYLPYASFVTSMREWCGKEVTISEIGFTVKDYERIAYVYAIEDDEDAWVFTQEMFEEKKMNNYAVVFRDKDKDNKLVRISGLTFQDAKRMAQRKQGTVHMMIAGSPRSVKVL